MTTAFTSLSFPDAAEAVKQSLDVVDIISRSVVLKKSGRNYMGLCPFHQDKKPSFSVSAEKGIYKCFSCGEGGDALAFLMKIQSKTYGEVITELADEIGIVILRDNQSIEKTQQQQSERKQIEALNQFANQRFQHQLKTNAGQFVRDYLTHRQMPEGIIQQFQLGYALPGWDMLLTALLKQYPEYQQNLSFLETSGLVGLKAGEQGQPPRAYDRFRNRLIIPIYDDADRLVAFGGRALAVEDNPKYLNSPETPIYHKSQILYGLNWAKGAIREHKTAMVMEGYFDVMAAHEAGSTFTVGSCGTALTEQHVKQLLRFGAETIILAFDADEAGQKAAESSIRLIEPLLNTKNIRLKVLTFPDGKDPDDYLRNHGAEAFQALVKQAPVDYLTFQLDRAMGTANMAVFDEKLAAVQRVIPILARVSQPVKLRELIERYSDRLQVYPQDLFQERHMYRQRYYPSEQSSATAYHALSRRGDDTKHHKISAKMNKRAIPSHQHAFRDRQQVQPSPQEHLINQSLPVETPLLKRQYTFEKALLTLLFVSPALYKDLSSVVFSHHFAQPSLKALAQAMKEMATDSLGRIQSQLHAAVQAFPEQQSMLTDVMFDADVYDQRFQASQWDVSQIDRALRADADRFLAGLKQCERLNRLAPMTEQIRQMEVTSSESPSNGEASLLGLQYEFRDKLSQHVSSLE